MVGRVISACVQLGCHAPRFQHLLGYHQATLLGPSRPSRPCFTRSKYKGEPGGTCLRRCSCAAGSGWSPGLCPVGSFSLTVSELQLLSGSRARLAKPGAGHAGLSAALQLGSHMRIRAPLGAHRLGFPTSGTSMRSPIPPREQQCLPWQPQGRPCGPPFHSTGWPSLLKTSLLGWGGGV